MEDGVLGPKLPHVLLSAAEGTKDEPGCVIIPPLLTVDSDVKEVDMKTHPAILSHAQVHIHEEPG